MMTLKDKHDAYIARAKAAGGATLTYRTPCCDVTAEDRVGPPTGQWDSLTTCATCGELYMKITTADRIIGYLLEDLT